MGMTRGVRVVDSSLARTKGRPAATAVPSSVSSPCGACRASSSAAPSWTGVGQAGWVPARRSQLRPSESCGLKGVGWGLELPAAALQSACKAPRPARCIAAGHAAMPRLRVLGHPWLAVAGARGAGKGVLVVAVGALAQRGSGRGGQCWQHRHGASAASNTHRARSAAASCCPVGQSRGALTTLVPSPKHVLQPPPPPGPPATG